METGIIVLITTSSLGIIGSLLYYGLRSYLKQTFKDIAKVQQVETITEIIEGVRINFKKELEEIKSELSVNAHKQNILFVEEKQSIYEFYAAYKIFSDSLLMYLHESSELEFIKEVIKKINHDYDNMTGALAKFELFNSDEPTFNSAIELVTGSLKMKGQYIMTFVELIGKLEERKVLETLKYQPIYLQERMESIKEINEYFHKLTEITKNEYPNLALLSRSFIFHAKNHIRK
jgi:hypothetical protein